MEKLSGGHKRFDEFYAEVFNKKRWKSLYTALRAPSRQVARVSAFADAERSTHILTHATGEEKEDGGDEVAIRYENDKISQHAIGVYSNCYVPCAPGGTLPQPVTISETSVKGWYFMDAASMIPVAYLGVCRGHAVLDMCAAPGGKTLAIADRMISCDDSCDSIEQWSLSSNEADTPRYKRLTRVIHEYVPQSHASHIETHNVDASRFHQVVYARYDRVLVDAPCSSERHILEPSNAQQLMTWSSSETRNRSTVQLNILMSALKCVKVNGIVVYSTCSISPLENDCVVSAAVERFNNLAENKREGIDCESCRILNSFTEYAKCMHESLDKGPPCCRNHFHVDIGDGAPHTGNNDWTLKEFVGEATRHGHIILPDKYDGHGPIYYSVIYKTSAIITEEYDESDDDDVKQ